ncbi:hypothetical protein GCK32_016703, partial [Trichostrongylus colubriformis]
MFKNQKIPLDPSKTISVTAMFGKTTRTTMYMNGTSVTQTIAEKTTPTPKKPVYSNSSNSSDKRTATTVNDTLIFDDMEGSGASLIDIIVESTESSLEPSTVKVDTVESEKDGEPAVLPGEKKHA